MAAVFLVGWAVGMAARSVEPWGDSPRSVYALVAIIMLLVGLVPLGFVVRELSRAPGWRLLVRHWGWLVVLGGSGLVALPLLKSATNSLDPSSIGEGGPSVLLILAGAVGLCFALSTLMTKRLYVGVLAAGAAGACLLGGALLFAR